MLNIEIGAPDQRRLSPFGVAIVITDVIQYVSPSIVMTCHSRNALVCLSN